MWSPSRDVQGPSAKQPFEPLDEGHLVDREGVVDLPRFDKVDQPPSGRKEWPSASEIEGDYAEQEKHDQHGNNLTCSPQGTFANFADGADSERCSNRYRSFDLAGCEGAAAFVAVSDWITSVGRIGRQD